MIVGISTAACVLFVLIVIALLVSALVARRRAKKTSTHITQPKQSGEDRDAAQGIHIANNFPSQQTANQQEMVLSLNEGYDSTTSIPLDLLHHGTTDSYHIYAIPDVL